jgi:hypothetical protein
MGGVAANVEASPGVVGPAARGGSAAPDNPQPAEIMRMNTKLNRNARLFREWAIRRMMMSFT